MVPRLYVVGVAAGWFFVQRDGLGSVSCGVSRRG